MTDSELLEIKQTIKTSIENCTPKCPFAHVDFEYYDEHIKQHNWVADKMTLSHRVRLWLTIALLSLTLGGIASMAKDGFSAWVKG